MSMIISEHEPEVTLPIDLDSSDEAARAVARQIIPFEYGLGDRSYPYLRWLCVQPRTPETTLLWLSDKPEFVDELGHRKGPRKLLERIIDLYGYPEAVLTLGLELFTASDASDAGFVEFLNRHADDGWLLGTLARADASSPDKDRTLDEAIQRHPDVEALRRVRRIRAQVREAEHLPNGPELLRLFEAGIPEVWLALAGNPQTPEEVLTKLESVQGVKCAKQIRQLAQQSLKLRSR